MKIVSLMILSLAISACATRGEVVVRSEPANAKVFFVDTVSGQNALIGLTPLTFDRRGKANEKSDVLQLRLEKEGFEPKYTAIASFGGETTFVDVKLNSVAVAKTEIRDAFEMQRTLLVEANRLVLAKRFPDALTRIDKILELDPKSADAFAAKGSILFLMKDNDGAKQAWTRSLELNPSFEGVRSSLIELNMHDVERAPASQGGQ